MGQIFTHLANLPSALAWRVIRELIEESRENAQLLDCSVIVVQYLKGENKLVKPLPC